MTTHDLATMLADDHRTLGRICTELELGFGSPESRRELADHLIAVLVRHDVAEAPHVAGSGLAATDDVMRELEGVGPQDVRFERLVSVLVRAVRRHLRDAGPSTVRGLLSAYSPARLRELGEAVYSARSRAAPFPHPAVADRVPPGALLRPGPGFVDRVRTALRDARRTENARVRSTA